MPRKPAKKKTDHARRIQNKEIRHGATFIFRDYEYIMQECDYEDGEPAYFQIWDITDPEPELIGRISGAVSCPRV